MGLNGALHVAVHEVQPDDAGQVLTEVEIPDQQREPGPRRMLLPSASDLGPARGAGLDVGLRREGHGGAELLERLTQLPGNVPAEGLDEGDGGGRPTLV